MKTQIIQSIKIIFLGAILVAGLSFAWTGPTVSQNQAPNNNVRGPIDISVNEQAKPGNLYIGYTASTAPTNPAKAATVDVDGTTYTQKLEAKMAGTTGGNIFVGNKMRISANTGGTFPATASVLNVAAGSIKSVPLATPAHDDPLPLCATDTGKIILCPLTAACGTADGQMLASAPTNTPATNLCSAGTASPVPVNGGTTGPWTWACTDSGSGATVPCGATKILPPTVTIVSTGSGTGFIETSTTGFAGTPLSSPNCPSGASTCGAVCFKYVTSTTCPISAPYDSGTDVILTADRLPTLLSSVFTGWSGDCVSVNNDPKKCKITSISSDKTVTANFEKTYHLDSFIQRVNDNNVSSISIVSTSINPSTGGSSISCVVSGDSYCNTTMTNYDGYYVEGTNITLKTAPSSEFIIWRSFKKVSSNTWAPDTTSTSCHDSTSDTCTITMGADREIRATFK